MGKFKKIGNYLFEEVNISLIPSPRKSIKNFKFRRIFPMTIFLLVAVSIITLSYLYNHYLLSYLEASKKVSELNGIKAENERLKSELYALTQDTEELRKYLNELQDYNEEIKGLIGIAEPDERENSESVDLELHTHFSSNQIISASLPIGGGDLQFVYQPSWQLIDKARENLDMLKKELPDQEERLGDLESSVIEYKALQAATPNIWPLADNGDAYISSNFGWRKDPFSGKQSMHEGLDIGTWYNTPVFGTADGVVKFAGTNGGYGRMITIDHGFGFETRYAHLNKILVKIGEKISRGDKIALSGNSGRSSGPHLHYEVRINNIPQNPRDYIGR